jgi:lysozyme
VRTEYKIGLGLMVAGGIGYVAYKKFYSRDISKKGLKLLTELEGKKNKAYKDSKGLWTIGVGHLIDLSKEKHLLTATLTDSQIHSLLNKDLDRFEKVVRDQVKVKLTPAKRDALIMLAFNIGVTAFKNSSLVKRINAKDSNDKIIQAFAMWDNPAELAKRRAKETRLFLTGQYSNFISANDFNKYYQMAA